MVTDKKNLIFDLGGVLLDIEPRRTFEAFAALGVDASILSESMTLANETMQAFEAGKISVQQLIDYIISLLPCDKRLQPREELEVSVRAAWCALLGAFPLCKWQEIARLRASGHKVFLLSNTNAIHWESIARGIAQIEGRAVEHYFDGVFLSYEMGLCKPSPEIFVQVLQRAGINAADTIFFDDSQANCDAARSVGIDAVVIERNSPWTTII